MIMKQIDKCLTRAFEYKNPSWSHKWKAFIQSNPDHGRILRLYHYCHLVLVYLVDDQFIFYEWWEKPADKRGLDSAKEWLEQYHKQKGGQ